MSRRKPAPRFVFDVDALGAVPREEHGRLAAEHLQVAENAVMHEAYDEAARLVCKAGDEMRKLGQAVETRYGLLACSQLERQVAKIQKMCGGEGVSSVSVVDGIRAMRNLLPLYCSAT